MTKCTVSSIHGKVALPRWDPVFFHFYRTILSEIERENERNILHYCAIFCPYYVIFFFSPFSFFFLLFFSFFLLFSPFFFLFSFSFSYRTIFCPYRTIFWSSPHYFLVFTALFPCMVVLYSYNPKYKGHIFVPKTSL